MSRFYSLGWEVTRVFFSKAQTKSYSFFKNIFISLAVPCLSCGMWDLVPLRDWAQGPLPWEHGVLATGTPGKSSGLHVKGRGCSPWKVQSAARGLRGRHQIQLKTGEQTAWWDGLECGLSNGITGKGTASVKSFKFTCLPRTYGNQSREMGL